MEGIRRFPWAMVPAVVLLLVALLAGCVRANGESTPYDVGSLKPGERALAKLPLEFDVAPENRLYLYGERAYSVRLVADAGDSLRLNGIPILPRRTAPPASEEHPEEQWLQVYGDVPFVKDLLRTGAAASDAGRLYESRQRDVRDGLLRVYEEARQNGHDRASAIGVAFSRLHDIDTMKLTDWKSGAEPTPTGIDLHWKGLPGLTGLYLGDAAEREDSLPTEDEKRLRATMIYERLAVLPGPCWYVIGDGFVATIYGQDNVARALKQLRIAGDTGSVLGGPIPCDAVLGMLELEEGR